MHTGHANLLVLLAFVVCQTGIILTFVDRNSLTYMVNQIFLSHVACVQLFLLGGVFLFCHAKGVRSRQLLSGIFFLCGLILLAAVLNRSDDSYYTFMRTVFFPPTVVVTGTFILSLTLLYIFEVVRPGWIGWKHGALVVLPWLGLTVIYYSVLYAKGEPVRVLTGSADMLNHIGEFNVWFRLPLFLINLAYLAVMHWVLFRYRKYYEQWCAKNFSSPDKMKLSWMKYFMYGLIVIAFFYCLIIFRAWYWAYEAHQLACFTTYSFLLYKGMFHESPYPKRYFAKTMNEAVAEAADSTNSVDGDAEATFSISLPVYVAKVKAWMDTCQPYLRKDLKLMDVSEVLPLNRTYLSRVFNEGFGDTFSQVVMGYRVEKAKQLLTAQEEINMGDVISLSGFSSHTTFYATFQKMTGSTPLQFRKQHQRVGS